VARDNPSRRFRRIYEEAQKALEQISQWVEENGLKMHPTKTRLVDASQRERKAVMKKQRMKTDFS
jgi:hypothetical protein